MYQSDLMFFNLYLIVYSMKDVRLNYDYTPMFRNRTNTDETAGSNWSQLNFKI